MWQQVHTVSETQIRRTFTIERLFNEQILIVKAFSGSASTTWHRAGYLQPVFQVEGLGVVKAERKRLILGTQLITFFNLQSPYFIEFQFLEWFLDIELTFWINSEFQSTDLQSQIINLTSLALENQEKIASLQAQLDRIEAKINSTSTAGTSSTQFDDPDSSASLGAI